MNNSEMKNRRNKGRAKISESTVLVFEGHLYVTSCLVWQDYWQRLFISNLVGENGGQRPLICSQIIWLGRGEVIHMLTSNLVGEGRGHSYVHK